MLSSPNGGSGRSDGGLSSPAGRGPERAPSGLAPRLVALGRARTKKLLTKVNQLLRQIEAQEKKASPTGRQRWQQTLRSVQDKGVALPARAGKSNDAVAVPRERTSWRVQVFLALARPGPARATT